MFNPWLAVWFIFFLGIFVIAIALMFPVLSTFLFYLLPIHLRSM